MDQGFIDEGPDGEESISIRGHRVYVGGLWEELGALQLSFLQGQGMVKDSFLLDLACGSLRLGVKAIPYLNTGHYMGIEKESQLLEAGIQHELGIKLHEAKRPQLLVSKDFEFGGLRNVADYVIAQSLFTHLTAERIELCMENLYGYLSKTSLFYATYFLSGGEFENPDRSHDHCDFYYTKDQILKFGQCVGFKCRFIGEWGHPRGQVIVEYYK